MGPSKGVRDNPEMIGFYRSKFVVGNRKKIAVKRGAHPLEQAICPSVVSEDVT